MEKKLPPVGKLSEELQQKIANIQTMDEFTDFVDELIKESDKKRKR